MTASQPMPPSLDQVRGDWPDLCDQVRRTDRRIAGLARVGEPAAVVGYALMVAFPSPVHAGMLERQPTSVTEVLAERYGGRWTILCQVVRRPPKPPEPMPPVDLIVI